MFDHLLTLSQRPALFSKYTADTLWTEPHLAKRMLEMHFAQDTALASRPIKAIDSVVNWIDRTYGLQGKSICDLGCGPGLYAQRYAERGARVTGLDFSVNSIAYAVTNSTNAVSEPRFFVGNYLTDELPVEQDLTTLIYCDLCALSPAQRHRLLSKIAGALKADGVFIFDVYSKTAFDDVKEDVSFARNLMDGFWSAEDYFAFQHTFRYESDCVSLDRFTIIEEHRSWSVYNWLQYFTENQITKELKAAGFASAEFVPGFDVDPNNDASFGVVARL